MHLSHTKLYLLTGVLGSMLTYMSCQNPEVVDVSPEYAIPLINSSLSIQNILDQTNTGDLLQIDGDNFITLEYDEEVLGIDTISLVSIPGFSIPQVTPTQVTPTPFPNDIDIDAISVKDGKLFINFESNSPNDITVSINIPSIKKNGNNLQYTMNVPNPNGTIPLIFQDSFDLTDYIISFDNDNFESNYTATDNITGLSVVPFNFFLDFPHLEYSYLEGYFGQVDFSIPLEELALNFPSQWVSGNVSFTDPQIRLRFENSYGFPLNLTFDTLQVLTRDEGYLDIQSTPINNPIPINYPALSNPGTSETTIVAIDNSNSNIVSVLEKAPYGFRYKMIGSTNPAGDPNIKGFVTDESRIVVRIIAELPLEGAIQDFTLVDTFALDLTGDAIPQGEAEFKIITDNGFPLDMDLQCYFLDEAGNFVDSLFVGSQTNIIQAASLGNNGKVTDSFETITFADVNSDRINLIRSRAKNLVLLGRFNSPDNGNTPIKIYSDYNLGVRIGVKIKPTL